MNQIQCSKRTQDYGHEHIFIRYWIHYPAIGNTKFPAIVLVTTIVLIYNVSVRVVAPRLRHLVPIGDRDSVASGSQSPFPPTRGLSDMLHVFRRASNVGTLGRASYRAMRPASEEQPGGQMVNWLSNALGRSQSRVPCFLRPHLILILNRFLYGAYQLAVE